MTTKQDKTPQEKKHHNQLIIGYNLEVLKKIEDESVDLIYIDPPIFSNRNYEIIWGDKGEMFDIQKLDEMATNWMKSKAKTYNEIERNILHHIYNNEIR